MYHPVAIFRDHFAVGYEDKCFPDGFRYQPFN